MDVIEIVSRYRYLGIVLDEMLDYSVTASVLADSSGRALGSLYTKYRNNKGFGHTTYTKMFDSCVSPILDYGSGVWGYNKLEKLDTVQNRAIRLFWESTVLPQQSNQWRYRLDTFPDQEARGYLAYMEPLN